MFSFSLTFIYMLLLYARIGKHKLQRSENIFVLYIFFGIAVAISLGYILALHKKVWALVPLGLYIMITITVFGDYKPSISYYQGDIKLCYLINNDILEQYKQAEYMGLDEFVLHIPESGLGSYSFTADRISNTLYRHGITSKRIRANTKLEPIDYFLLKK